MKKKEFDSKKDSIKKQYQLSREKGIRTLDTLLTHTRFPSVRLKPLGHLSNFYLSSLNIAFELS